MVLICAYGGIVWMNTPEAQTKDNDTVHNVFIAIICLMTLVAAGCRNAVSENHDTATEMDTAAEEGSDIVVSSDTDSATNRDLMGVAAQMDWVMLEPATFTIGSPESEWGHGLDEVHHQVTHIHRYEITSTEVVESIKELAQLDGAFIISEKGIVQSI